MAFLLRLRRALHKEYPVTALAKILPTGHKLSGGMALALSFENNFIDLRLSEVPPSRLKKYNEYLSKCHLFLTPQSIEQ